MRIWLLLQKEKSILNGNIDFFFAHQKLLVDASSKIIKS